MFKLIYVIFTTLLLFSKATEANEMFLLTKGLDFIDKSNGKVVKLEPEIQPTLFRKISESKGIVEVELIQRNGRPSTKRYSLYANWFSRGTQAAQEFHVDPNKIIQSINPIGKDCNPTSDDWTAAPESSSCDVLKSSNKNTEDYLKCFEHLKQKLAITPTSTAYSVLPKLYTLAQEEQIFLASIMTMYGEARGLSPVQKQMAAVMKIVDNRLKKVQRNNPSLRVNYLDIVLQNSQFSMFNPKDHNWRKALLAKPEEMKDAVTVFAEAQWNQLSVSESTCHYAATKLCRSANPPSWASASNEVKISGLEGHSFFKNVAWGFNENNRYKQYAQNQGIIK